MLGVSSRFSVNPSCIIPTRIFEAASTMDARGASLMAAAVFCAVMPLEISHLISALVGAVAYLLLQTMQPSVERPSDKASKGRAFVSAPSGTGRGPLHWRAPVRQGSSKDARSGPHRVRQNSDTTVAARQPEVRKPSVAPVSAPTFHAVGWDAEVEELLHRIAPTPEGDALVAKIVENVRRDIRPAVPEAQVAGFVSGNILGRTAFGVAVPDVDIVVTIASAALKGRLQGRWSECRTSAGRLDARKLQKSAIRICTDRLVSMGGFKFRRSAFRGCEPKVTLIAPASVSGDLEQSVPINLSVNAVTPVYSAALLTECGSIDQRAKELILIVKRWAKDRGVSHAAKGHLSPYSWSLLVIYFLQVASREEGPILPPLEGFQVSPGIMIGVATKPRAVLPQPKQGVMQKSVGCLFTDFVNFYAKEFDWHGEAVAVRSGQRSAPDATLPLHIILHENGSTTEVGPSIEDPFEISSNLGGCCTQSSLVRLREELERAARFCSSGASLTALLEPWAPPEVSLGGIDENEEEKLEA
mmetsp:Transcript_55879/g.122688  ORF Transcript_55879/g.122688 Transcript_55879/m.122688 type:complete len:528 (-) Transcript_55879:186-1769(-)